MKHAEFIFLITILKKTAMLTQINEIQIIEQMNCK